MVSSLLVLKIVLIAIGVIVVISILQFLVSIHPPRYRDEGDPSDHGMEYENVSFVTEDGVKISAWLIPSKKANGTVVVGHGYPFDKANILPVVTYLHPDYNLLLYDHRYFGDSEGRITTVGIKEVKDVEAAVDFASKRFGKPIALYGFSLSASAMLMSKAEVSAIVADSPYADLEMMIKRVYAAFGPFKYPFVEISKLLGRIFFGVDAKDISPTDGAKDKDVPMLLIHGEKDTQISSENSRIIKEANPDIELWIVPGADHGMAYALVKDEYQSRVKKFLKKHMSGK